MLDRIKEEAFNAAGRFAGAGKGIDLLSSPSLQAALTRALTLQAELRDRWDRQVQAVAKSLNLVSKRDVLTLKRQVRDLENLVATLEHQLKQQTLRTKKAESALRTPSPAPAGTPPAAKKSPAKKKRASTTKTAAKVRTASAKKLSKKKAADPKAKKKAASKSKS
jgi:hypothetical protein